MAAVLNTEQEYTLFTKCKLGDIAKIYSGYAFKSSDLCAEGIPVLKIANIQNHKVLKKCESYLPETLYKEKLKKYSLHQDDFLIAMTGAGSVGKVGKMNKVDKQYLVNQRVAIVRVDSNLANPTYVFNAFATPHNEDRMYSIAFGAGQPNLSSSDIGNLDLPLPPRETQDKIASILSAYDDLIENNTRRIAILEAMAQALYREWFVHFRYPGHGEVPLVDSPLGPIPQGWEVKAFADVFDIKYGKNLPISKLVENGAYPVYGAGGIIGFYSEKISNEKICLVTCRGNGSGVVSRTREPAFITNNSLLLSPQKKYIAWNYAFVEFQLKNSNIMGVLSGSAQPQITINGISTVSIICPDNKLVQKFVSTIGDIPELIDKLYYRNNNLRQARDLLLPRLISGQLDVSELEVV